MLFWLAFTAGALQGAEPVPAQPPGSTVTDTRQTEAARQVQAAMDRAIPVPAEPGVAGPAAAPQKPSGSGGKIIGLIILAVIVAAGVRLLVMIRKKEPARATGPDGDQQERVRTQFQRYGETTTMPDTQLVVPNPKFLELAVKQGIASQDAVTGLRARFKDNAFAILMRLAEQYPSRKAELGRLWADALDIAFADPGQLMIQQELTRQFPLEFLKKRIVLPLFEIENVVTCAMATPTDRSLVKQIEEQGNKFISPVFSFPDQILTALEIIQVSAPALASMISGKPGGPRVSGGGEISEEYLRNWMAEDAVTEFSHGLLLLALQRRASDIHIEPHEEGVHIRFRIDGQLQEVLRMASGVLPSVVNVLKILAGVDIGERRRPQDGHITLSLPDRALDLRFSSVPTIYGEKIVMRLLGQNQFTSVPDLENLDYSKAILEGVKRIMASPNGVFFVTGPTGSGKTTTLYAAVKSLKAAGINIMTIEDPVEYRLPGVNQVQVNTLAGVTFATALRSFLRQDPDVILVGEIRDLETAKIAAQAALTGHLVLTTMHTNNSLQAITRLIQIGVEPFLVAPSIIGVMAQRLVRRLCPHCRQRYELTPAEADKLFVTDGKTPVYFHRAKGCVHCNSTGYFGRIAIHELFIIDDETRDYIAHNATILDIQKHAIEKGFTDMRYDGIKKVMRGLTTLEEVDQVSMASE